MRWFDALFTRQRTRPHADRLGRHIRQRMRHACRELSASEREMARAVLLDEVPRMLMVDEEAGVILTPDQRRAIEGDD